MPVLETDGKNGCLDRFKFVLKAARPLHSL